MKHQILAVGLKEGLLSHCREYFAGRNIGLKDVKNIGEAVHAIKKEAVHLLVMDMEYLRKIRQSNWIQNVRYASFIPVIVLSNIPEADIGPTTHAGADACYDSSLSPSSIAFLLLAQLRRYTEYNHFREPETAPFQVGDIAIDPVRHLVWVRGRSVQLFPREFSLLHYFMQNPDIVLTHEQIYKHAWKKRYSQGIVQSVHDLRHKIEPNPSNPIYIKTVHRVGYRFLRHFVEERR